LTFDSGLTEPPAVRSCHIGATVGATVMVNGVGFRVWAPKSRSVEVVVEKDPPLAIPLAAEGDGYFSGMTPEARPGDLYRYRLDGDKSYPDPASRFQPQGPHGPSQVVNPDEFPWHDTGWPGVHLHGQVLYEVHIGTFTPEGTFDAAARELPELRRFGITLIEVMPLAECPGRWNWGYDGVDLYAPSHNYGDAHAFKRFVDAAHQLGIGVILDVVYNHVGPDGNYLSAFSDDYFTNRYVTDWGDPINFDGENSHEVREFYLQNACYWITEFHLDGLRLDATQNIYDSGPRHILAELSHRTRAAAGERSIVLIAENESQDVTCITPIEQGGYGLDAIWNDDFHHTARVALTGRREAYYTDYCGSPQEFISAVKRGFLYQGQYYTWQKQLRGTLVTDQAAEAFVLFLQNHDQVANSLHGERITQIAGLSRYRALTALTLLAPGTPMFFMGQEFGASTPFLYFTDHGDKTLAEMVQKGRQEFLTQFVSYASDEVQKAVPDPNDPATFERSKLNLEERRVHSPLYRFHEDLLRLRRTDPVLARQDRKRLDGAVLGPDAFVLRFFGGTQDDRLLIVNLGLDLSGLSVPEPLLAPGRGCSWRLVWSSDHPRYGGPGLINPYGGHKASWRLPAGCAAFLAEEPA
jgi:maltooligosyltrehalose trehalohydrolase